MNGESTQDKLTRVRKPRVHITFTVETEGARVVRELPFVMGVIGDFAGDSTKKQPALADRKFVEISRDNFDVVMQRMNIGLELDEVPNTLKGDGSTFKVNLAINRLGDFEPGSIVQQVEPLSRLVDIRNRLRDLASKADRSPELEELLEKLLTSGQDLNQLAAEIAALTGVGGSAPSNDQPSPSGGNAS